MGIEFFPFILLFSIIHCDCLSFKERGLRDSQGRILVFCAEVTENEKGVLYGSTPFRLLWNIKKLISGISKDYFYS